VRVWRGNNGPEIYGTDPRTQSNSVTTVLLPDGHDADKARAIALDRFNVSLGGGLDKLDKRVFRIGHMGDLNELMLLGALAGTEMAMRDAGVAVEAGSGVAAAEEHWRQVNVEQQPVEVGVSAKA
jgi:alanine-glyoxylate transaminase/serine-glyoxylate transaminase/serine-pyruvate transaminase